MVFYRERKVRRFDDDEGEQMVAIDLCSWSAMTSLGLMNLESTQNKRRRKFAATFLNS